MLGCVVSGVSFLAAARRGTMRPLVGFLRVTVAFLVVEVFRVAVALVRRVVPDLEVADFERGERTASADLDIGGSQERSEDLGEARLPGPSELAARDASKVAEGCSTSLSHPRGEVFLGLPAARLRVLLDNRPCFISGTGCHGWVTSRRPYGFASPAFAGLAFSRSVSVGAKHLKNMTLAGRVSLIGH